MSKFLDYFAHFIVISIGLGFAGCVVFVAVVLWPLTILLMIGLIIMWAVERVSPRNS